MYRPAALLLIGLLLLPTAVAGAEAPFDDSRDCPPAAPVGPCHLAQTGSLAIVCADQCDIVASGSVTAKDSFPVKQIRVRMDLERLATVGGGCTGIGFTETRCELDMRFPFLIAPGSCIDVKLTTSYVRSPFSSVVIAKTFEACRGTDGTNTVTAV